MLVQHEKLMWVLVSRFMKQSWVRLSLLNYLMQSRITSRLSLSPIGQPVGILRALEVLHHTVHRQRIQALQGYVVDWSKSCFTFQNPFPNGKNQKLRDVLDQHQAGHGEGKHSDGVPAAGFQTNEGWVEDENPLLCLVVGHIVLVIKKLYGYLRNRLQQQLPQNLNDIAVF